MPDLEGRKQTAQLAYIVGELARLCAATLGADRPFTEDAFKRISELVDCWREDNDA